MAFYNIFHNSATSKNIYMRVLFTTDHEWAYHCSSIPRRKLIHRTTKSTRQVFGTSSMQIECCCRIQNTWCVLQFECSTPSCLERPVLLIPNHWRHSSFHRSKWSFGGSSWLDAAEAYSWPLTWPWSCINYFDARRGETAATSVKLCATVKILRLLVDFNTFSILTTLWHN